MRTSQNEATMEGGDLGSSAGPPKDTFNVAYFIYFLLGAGYLVPWNAFITAIDYFELLYPSGRIDYLFSITYMIPCVVGIILITFYGKGIPAVLRVNGGLALFIAMLVLVPVMGAVFLPDAKGTQATYAITIIAAGMNGLADALVQGSVVGSAGELPPRYMQAVMCGTAASGLLISALRLITRGVMSQNNAGIEASAYLYFIVSTVIMVLCTVCYNVAGKLPVIQYYDKLKKSPLESIHLLGPENLTDGDKELKAADLLGYDTVENNHKKHSIGKTVSYAHVWKKVKWLALAVAFIYVVTLSIFPGHITEDLHSSYFGDWYGILLTLAYNLFDFIGKFLPAFSKFMIQRQFIAIAGSVARALFYPLFYLCLHGPNFFQSDAFVILLTCLFGFSNGYLTTVLMIIGPKSVPIEEAEVTGFLMVLLLILGLAAGSILEWVWVL